MIKSWQMFLESSESEVEAICKKHGIENWSINPDTGLVDVDGDVDLSELDLNKLPIKFGKVSGCFWCHVNNLTTLEGSPYEVGGGFYCSSNRLKTLEGCPKKVDGYFWCDDNKLISLEGLDTVAIRHDMVDFNAKHNPIINLTSIGINMIKNKISFLESIVLNISEISDSEFNLIFKNIAAQKILELNNFKLFNLLRTNLPKKYAEICALRNVDLSSDLGELGF